MVTKITKAKPKKVSKLRVSKLTLAGITSEDLEDYLDPDYIDSLSPRQEAVDKLLKDKVKEGELFDWKELKDMPSYLVKFMRRHPAYKYAYNAYPGGDGVLVVFSKVKLPKAEEV